MRFGKLKKTGAGILAAFMLAAMVSVPVFAEEDPVQENPSSQMEETGSSSTSAPSGEGESTPGPGDEDPQEPTDSGSEVESTGGNDQSLPDPGEIIPGENQEGTGEPIADPEPNNTDQYAELTPDTIADAPLDSTPVTSFDPNDFSALISSEAASSQVVSGFAFSDEEKSDGGASWLFLGGIALIVLAVAGIAFFVYNQFIAPRRTKTVGKRRNQRTSPAVQTAHTAKTGLDHKEEEQIPDPEKPAQEREQVDWDAFFEQNKRTK